MSVSAVGILNIIQKNDLNIFRTAGLITLTGMRSSAVTHALRRLARRHLVISIKRNLWAVGPAKNIYTYELVPFLSAPWPSYVSLYSALSQYSVVEEVPHIIYAVTSGRPAKFKTPIGTFHFHHLPGRLFWGYEMKRSTQGAFPMAEPEKAFLDLVYLALTPRSGLELPQKRGRKWNLNNKRLWAYAKKFNFKPLEKALKSIFNFNLQKLNARENQWV